MYNTSFIPLSILREKKNKTEYKAVPEILYQMKVPECAAQNMKPI